MIFEKGFVSGAPENNISLSYSRSNEIQEPKTICFSFDAFQEPLFLSSSSLTVVDGFSGRVIVLNESGKAVVLYDSTSVKGFEASFSLSDGVFLLTRKTMILLEIHKAISSGSSPLVTIPFAFLGAGIDNLKNLYFSSYGSFPTYMKRTFISLSASEKRLISAKDFDFLLISVGSDSYNRNARLKINGNDFEFRSSSVSNFQLLKDASFYEIENSFEIDVVLLLVKNVFNTETFLAYQYLLDLRILDLSISLRNDFHNTMSKIYFGELPDIEKLQSERQLLLHSDFNEANKGYYDDYEYSVPSDEELQGALPLPS